ncbi:hypothetical protein M3196_20990 [Fictibacillus nanhaiensis]|jgi:Zn finger protein HypA/HybF involved in hydrogenase expression|uniref:hypothetical protein n=1 Tax=Fictibacillus nanhaiensis TaxID=742169 RepID=UPI00203F1EC7|nr:hypothetical protein [Fictibacillus nanhaiensis]MCM3732713.1 hypothetical protein [Fictibacillus nanhaiensis]MCM3734114.1 hypothetical protein [Fictibacillus nanhaiensis]
MTTKKEQDELNKDFFKSLEEEDPFGLNEEIKTITFTCKDCHEEDDVPDFVVAEFGLDKKKGEEVEVQCPSCGGTMIQARKNPK